MQLFWQEAKIKKKKDVCEPLFPYQPMETIYHKPSASQSWCLSRRRFYSSDHVEAEMSRGRMTDGATPWL